MLYSGLCGSVAYPPGEGKMLAQRLVSKKQTDKQAKRYLQIAAL